MNPEADPPDPPAEDDPSDVSAIRASLRRNADTRLPELFTREYKRLVSYVVGLGVMRAEAKEIAAQAFAQLLQSKDLPSISQLTAFLYAVAKNITFNRRMHLAMQQRKAHLLTAEHGEEPLTPELELMEQQRSELLLRTLAQLPPKCRAFMGLRFWQQLSYPEIVELLRNKGIRINERTVRREIARGLEECRNSILASEGPTKDALGIRRLMERDSKRGLSPVELREWHRWGADADNEAEYEALYLLSFKFRTYTCPPLPSDEELKADLLQVADRPADESTTAQGTATPEIRFAHLDATVFESLIADLFTATGYGVQRMPTVQDTGFDFVASRPSRDPFGAEKTESCLVSAKLYKEQRVSVSVLRQMFRSLTAIPGPTRGVIVTNGHMTSVAREFLEELERKSDHEMNVLEGTELTELLMQRPELVERYFGSASKK